LSKLVIFCEEAGDKEVQVKQGSSSHYIITSIIVKEENEVDFIKIIETLKSKILGLNNTPLEWKNLYGSKKRNDKLLGRFFKKINEQAPPFLISNVICNKNETSGSAFVDKKLFMNYLYGLMFKRISYFLKRTDSTAKLIIDRNTDKFAQLSLHHYISMISRHQTGQYPRHSKPKWINPEEHPILGLSDFISGVSLRSITDYQTDSHIICTPCPTKNNDCIYICNTINFEYKKSYHYIKGWNYAQLKNWNWKGLIYHPYEFKNNYQCLFQPK